MYAEPQLSGATSIVFLLYLVLLGLPILAGLFVWLFCQCKSVSLLRQLVEKTEEQSSRQVAALSRIAEVLAGMRAELSLPPSASDELLAPSAAEKPVAPEAQPTVPESLAPEPVEGCAVAQSLSEPEATSAPESSESSPTETQPAALQVNPFLRLPDSPSENSR